MVFKYKGKPMTDKQANAFLKRISLKPRAVYNINIVSGKVTKKRK
jgi:hypothetical protein